MERLNKYLANSGFCSRREADNFIAAGKVKVNGIAVPELGTKVDPEKDIIEFNSKTIKPSVEFIYYALNKPYSVVSTAKAQDGEKTVLDFVPASPRVYPVGRLDKNSKGLIILTNDGELTKELTHPSFEHQKHYRVSVQRRKIEDESDIKKITEKFTKGIEIDGKIMKADSVVVESLGTRLLSLDIILHTGYNRQIRKMCAKIGLEIRSLVRTKIGKLSLDELSLKSGEYKLISKKDIVDV